MACCRKRSWHCSWLSSFSLNMYPNQARQRLDDQCRARATACSAKLPWILGKIAKPEWVDPTVCSKSRRRYTPAASLKSMKQKVTRDTLVILPVSFASVMLGKVR
jgi:hypothetical protein